VDLLSLACDCRTARPAASKTEAMETTRPARRVTPSVVTAAVIVVALVYSWIASRLRPFSHPMEVAVSIPLVIAAIVIFRSRRRLDAARDAGEPVCRRGTWVWVVLVASLLAWELVSYRMSPRVDHPTLSSIADAVIGTHPSRFAMFVAWLAAGYWLFRR
jgi:hypothetical protein